MECVDTGIVYVVSIGCKIMLILIKTSDIDKYT